MGRQLNRLTARQVETARVPGLHCDGGGLYLKVTSASSKTWIFRFRSPVTGKLRDMGLGPVHSVTLSEARAKAGTQRVLLLDRRDPIDAREQEARRLAAEAAKALTFSECAASYIDAYRPGWTNGKHASQWENTLATYASPVFGHLPIQSVDTALVLKVLEPIWATKPETASRLRARIENILDWAKARGYRSGENPARWRGHLNQLLPTLAKKARVVHHRALPFSHIAELAARLRQLRTVSARCLEFTILTAARTNEAIGARPEEFDLAAGVWTIPGERMKAGREHRVPLASRAVEIVTEMMRDHPGPFVFPGAKPGASLSNMAMLNTLDRMKVDVTVHGFRSTFRDWAAECTTFPRDVCEMALAHTITNAAEAAYRRGDLFDRRQKLMEAWASFVDGHSAIPLRLAA
jgi:integrase